MKSLTKKEIDLFATIFIGSMALYTEVGLEDCYDQLSEDEVQKLCDSVVVKASKILGKHDSFSSVKEILDYVKS